MKSRSVVLAASAFLAACSATPIVTTIATRGNPPEESSKDGTFPGVPFRTQSKQVVRIYALDLETGTYQLVSSYEQYAADLSRVYVLDVKGSDFASPSLHIAQNQDNTLKIVGVTSTASAASAGSAATALTGVAKAQSDKASAQLTSDSAVATAQKNLRDALDAVSKLPTTAGPDLIAAYQAAVSAARFQLDAACHAAAVAGTPCPAFP